MAFDPIMVGSLLTDGDSGAPTQSVGTGKPLIAWPFLSQLTPPELPIPWIRSRMTSRGPRRPRARTSWVSHPAHRRDVTRVSLDAGLVARARSSATRPDRAVSSVASRIWTARDMRCDCDGCPSRLDLLPGTTISIGNNGRIEARLTHLSNGLKGDAHLDLRQSDLDDIFNRIDSYSPNAEKRQEKSPGAFFLSSFGVFEVQSPPNVISPAHHGFHDNLAMLANIAADSWMPDDTQDIFSADSFDASPNLGNYGSLPQTNDTSTVFTPSRESAVTSRPDTSSVIQTPRPQLDVSDSQHPERRASSAKQRSMWWKDDRDAVIYNPSPFQMPEVERFLMNHYVHRVVHLFCVTDYEKSPWKTIHLPRVLQSTGQLSLHGSTTKIREALRNALLSISAFYLANDSSSRACQKEAGTWANDAIKFRGRAIKLLKETVESSTPESRPKYKELLVMSGDTSTCGIHLDGAFRFMNHVRDSKSKYSSKARSLHRIYFYLRVIYDSTACRHLDKSTTSPASPEVDFGTALSVSLLDKEAEDDPAKSVLSHVAAPRASVGEYECVYGVPQSLLILLARTTDVIDQVENTRASTGALTPALEEQCNELESDIIDWKPETPVEEDGANLTAKVIDLNTTAFHNALVIYFAQHIRLIRHSYLRTHIETVLNSIEAIEKINADSGSFSAPLYWPAFIAGSEAFDAGFQERFKAWYVQVESYRLASVRSGIDVLRQVWEEGPAMQSRTTSQWRVVVQKTGARLMLS
ncbi:fungal specific transcription factor domain-containing protein [Sarocladium implicatum]|nr:fungal specific transcription factor domain-containing protein [Sarocladium implicatum]